APPPAKWSRNPATPAPPELFARADSAPANGALMHQTQWLKPTQERGAAAYPRAKLPATWQLLALAPARRQRAATPLPRGVQSVPLRSHFGRICPPMQSRLRTRARASPRRESPRRASPRRESPRRGSPRRGSPRRGSPRRESPRRASPREAGAAGTPPMDRKEPASGGHGSA